MMKTKLFPLFLAVLFCVSMMAIPASAQSNENEEPLPPLTPDGNMNLVDDMVTSSGKQFITVTTRDGTTSISSLTGMTPGTRRCTS